mmetsp:Transcript_4902/g.12458  ORF Transcript_4902/g.12458 Transcript_4902/m.12458 type:complete len:326 (+) Transcript_4902:75-1052(+)
MVSRRQQPISLVHAGCIAIAFLLGHLHGTYFPSYKEMMAGADGETSKMENYTFHFPDAITSVGLKHQSQKEQTASDGWASIEVFYGDTVGFHDSAKGSQDLGSQSGQHKCVTSLLKGKRNGYFIDLAANDATRYSNSYFLEQDFDWTGLCIEPNPMHWSKLVYRKCQVVGALVGNRTMEQVKYRIHNADDIGGHAGIIMGDLFDNKAKDLNDTIPLYTVSLAELLHRFNAPRSIDYLSLDVEGAEEFILRGFPLEDYTISIMTIERPTATLMEFLQERGFEMLAVLAAHGETLWVHTSAAKDLDQSVLEKYKRFRYDPETRDKYI